MSTASRARWVARGAAVGGSGGALLGAFGFGLLYGEAKLARRTVKPPLEGPPVTEGEYGTSGPSIRVAVLGDSSAAGIGCGTPDAAPGHLLARMLADAGRRVRLDVYAVSGARSTGLAAQVDRALLAPPHVAVVSVGANDVTHLVRPEEACTALGVAVARLVAAGASVVVGTCPDLGAVRPIAQPLRSVAHWRSRQLAAAQAVAAERAGGVAVPLGALIGRAFRDEPDRLFCSDRFHPSAAGYRLFAEALGPLVLAAAGCEPTTQPETQPEPGGRVPAPRRVQDEAHTDAGPRPTDRRPRPWHALPARPAMPGRPTLPVLPALLTRRGQETDPAGELAVPRP